MMSSIDRRKFLQRAGVASAAAGTLWVAPSVVGSSAAFAAGSGTTTYPQMEFYKYNNSQGTYSQSTACSPGYVKSQLTGAAVRGGVDVTFTASTSNLCFTITLSSGPSIGTRIVYLLASNASGCLATINTGPWGAGTASTYSTCAVVPVGTTEVTVTAEESGGGGTAIYTMDHIVL